MAKKVYKYAVPVDDNDHELVMPTGARVVHVGPAEVPDEVLFWAEFLEREDLPASEARFQVARKFRVFGTGHYVPEQYEYWGTCQARYGLVWHLYERKVT